MISRGPVPTSSCSSSPSEQSPVPRDPIIEQALDEMIDLLADIALAMAEESNHRSIDHGQEE